MTDAELYGCFAWDRDADGRPKLPGGGGAQPGEKEFFRRHCFLNCVTDPAEVERLWAEKVAARSAAQPERGGRRG